MYILFVNFYHNDVSMVSPSLDVPQCNLSSVRYGKRDTLQSKMNENGSAFSAALPKRSHLLTLR